MNTFSFQYILLGGTILAASLAACDGGKGDTGFDEGLIREDLGSTTTDTAGGADISFEAPADAVSALITCGPYGYDTLATAETITDPNGGTIFSYETDQGTALRMPVTDDLLPVLIPQSPDLDLTAGIYGIRLYFSASGAVTVGCNALYRVQEPTASQTVDIHFVFVGVDGDVPGLNAFSAVDNAPLNETLAGVGELWAGLGLAVGEVTYADFAGDVELYNSVDGATEFGNLLKTNTSEDRAVTLFMVGAITDDDGATILGQAAGPPGAPAIGGTSKSGAVVTVGFLADGDTDTEARIIAHEVGHFMGLFHPTEKDGSGHDPLSDTPECTSDADGNGTYASDECGGQGADYLMWWAASAASVNTSDDQGWVVQRSALPH